MKKPLVTMKRMIFSFISLLGIYILVGVLLARNILPEVYSIPLLYIFIILAFLMFLVAIVFILSKPHSHNENETRSFIKSTIAGVSGGLIVIALDDLRTNQSASILDYLITLLIVLLIITVMTTIAVFLFSNDDSR